jgi:hypothetical protein
MSRPLETVELYLKSVRKQLESTTLLQDNLALPFEAEMLGVRETVESTDLTPAEEIVALCRRGKHRQTIPVLYLPLPSPPPAGAERIEAYRHWTPGM